MPDNIRSLDSTYLTHSIYGVIGSKKRLLGFMVCRRDYILELRGESEWAMRILFVTDDITFVGGIQSYLGQLCTTLTENGHSTELFSPKGDRVRDLFSRWVSLNYYREFRSRLLKFNPDLVHAHSLSLQLSPLPLKAAADLNIPIVMTIHDFNYVCPRKWLIRKNGEICAPGIGFRCFWSDCRSSKEGWIYFGYHGLRLLKILLHRRLLQRYVSLFVCPSKVLQKSVNRSWGIRDSAWVPNFIHSHSRPDVRRPRTDLLYVGRLSPEKGIETLISSFPAVLRSFPDVHLKIIGGGPDEQRLKSLSKSTGLQSRIQFLGIVENQMIREHFKSALLSIIPSIWMENCPVTVIEAMAAGCPQVGSRRGGIEEMIVEGKTGCCFHPGDPQDLAEKIIRLLQHPERLNQMGLQSRIRYESRYTPDVHLSRLLRIYDQAIARR